MESIILIFFSSVLIIILKITFISKMAVWPSRTQKKRADEREKSRPSPGSMDE